MNYYKQKSHVDARYFESSLSLEQHIKHDIKSFIGHEMEKISKALCDLISDILGFLNEPLSTVTHHMLINKNSFSFLATLRNFTSTSSLNEQRSAMTAELLALQRSTNETIEENMFPLFGAISEQLMTWALPQIFQPLVNVFKVSGTVWRRLIQNFYSSVFMNTISSILLVKKKQLMLLYSEPAPTSDQIRRQLADDEEYLRQRVLYADCELKFDLWKALREIRNDLRNNGSRVSDDLLS